jgi:hypothetical protein
MLNLLIENADIRKVELSTKLSYKGHEIKLNFNGKFELTAQFHNSKTSFIPKSKS